MTGESAAAISADGQLAAVDIGEGARGERASQIEIIRIADGCTKIVSASEERAFGTPSWAPKGQILAYYVGRGENAALRVIDAATDTSKTIRLAATVAELPFEKPHWIRDGKMLLVIESGQRSGGNVKEPEDKGRPVVLQGDDPGAASEYARNRSIQNTVVAVEPSTGRERILFTGGVLGLKVSPDGKTAVMHVRDSVDSNTDEIHDRLVILDTQSGSVFNIPRSYTGYFNEFSWSPTGGAIAWIAAHAPDVGSLYIAQLNSAATKVRSCGTVSRDEDKITSPAPLWSQTGRLLFVVGDGRVKRAAVDDCVLTPITTSGNFEALALASNEVGSVVAKLNGSPLVIVRNRRTGQQGFARLRSKRLEPLMLESQAIGDVYGGLPTWDAAAHSLIFRRETVNQPEDLWSWSPRAAARRLTDFNPDLSGILAGNSTLLSLNNSRGDSFKGALLTPSTPPPPSGYPLVVEVYGGGDLSTRLNNFGGRGVLGGMINADILLTRGYAVLFTDTPIRPGNTIADVGDDIQSAVAGALAVARLDRNRLALTGHSYGGYSVVGTITHLHMFKVAIVGGAFADLTSLGYGDSAVGPGYLEAPEQGGMPGSPWQNPDVYRDNSPFWRLDKVQTPLLLVHGGDDPIVPKYEAVMIFKALSRLHKNVELVIYPEEGHSIATETHLQDLDRRVLEFLSTHLKESQDP